VRRLVHVTVGLVLAISAVTAAAQDKTARVPVLVELFTSEGCSSCPSADLLLTRLLADQPVAGAQIIALGQHVDYWDSLGWADPFASRVFTNRQGEYRQRLRLEQLFTPQMVVDGRESLVGSDSGAARKAIGKAARSPKGSIALSVAIPGPVEITAQVAGLQRAGLRQRANLTIAVTENGLITNVERGENQGRKLSHAAVVRAMAVVKELEPSADTADVLVPVVLESTWSRDHLDVVAFVQERDSGRILAAAMTPLR
jgi:hypothetical protein